ncbi:ribosome-binding protein 1 isoform X2 [Amblyraja radiata]|uniref:ribosome-binding protein 1 isoform X2 n=1 Tax=Amblyraja radiata TaxID=386614 RepID=UPI0014039E65|nr:ribosome-binding protein 1 isoform X2 [Amblyraja radiata]
MKMDIYDPQTLGFMVFGGFMVISAIGIFLVSTFSMKETSYEEALAKQKREQEKALQARSEKKKKEKSVDKKGKVKKREEKANGRIPETEPVPDVSEAEGEVEAVIVPSVETPILAVAAPAPPAPTPESSPPPASKEKRRKEKKVAKVDPAPGSVPAPATGVGIARQPPIASPLLEPVSREVPVMAVPPVGSQLSTPLAAAPPTPGAKKPDASASQDEPKQEGPAKKKVAPKKKSEPVAADSLDSPLYIPFKTLLSTMSSMDFSEGEVHRLIEILMDKAGIVQDTWHTATQRGDPVTALRRQLEEKEKQLVAEQEDASAAKTKLRELNKELAAEKVRAGAGDAKLREQLAVREEELNAMQSRMQASYQEHLSESQRQQAKVRALQEQLDNGPTAQIARLQQENSILRDALNQATSQSESKQNAELAKLQQDCSRLSKELGQQNETVRQDGQLREALEARVSTYQQELAQQQGSQQETESTLQRRLDEVSEELRRSQGSYAGLLTDTERAREEQRSAVSTCADLQAKLTASEAELKSKAEEVEGLGSRLSEVSVEKGRMEERIRSIDALLEASQSKETERDQVLQATKQVEVEQLENRLKDKNAQISILEQEMLQLKETVEHQKKKNNELREKNWKAMEALASMEKLYREKLDAAKQMKMEQTDQQLQESHTQTIEVLLELFPELSVSSPQPHSEWLQEFRQKAMESLNQRCTDPSGAVLKLREAEEAQSTLQADCEQYRTVLAETEGMLRNLQKSVEEEELVWKAKIAELEAQVQQAQSQVKTSEATVEKLKLDSQTSEQLKDLVIVLEGQLKQQIETVHTQCQTYSVEVKELSDLLMESQSQLEAANRDVQKHSEELSLVRQQLCDMEVHVHHGVPVEMAGGEAQQGTAEVMLQLEETVLSEQAQRQKLAEEFEKAQRSALELQEELEKLRAARSGDSEDLLQLKERLDKEKKMTKDLGQTASKLQQMLTTTQEQLDKEKETVQRLLGAGEGKGEEEEGPVLVEDGLKEGTSV